MSVAQWVYEHRQPAGLSTDTLPGAKALYLPLVASGGPIGVVGILPNTATEGFEPERFHYLEAFANQTAIAIERSFLGEAAQRALLKAETESLRNTLLSSISHDLRTPLSAITGAATTLLQEDVMIDQVGRLDLLQTIQEEAEHLNRIIKNVLDMTRLESGAITVNKEWQPLEEIVGVVLNRLGDRLNDHPVTVKLPGNLPLIPFDGLLIEQVLMNLFDNAIKYTPKGTPLELSASESFYTVTVELADRGPGIPPGEEERIFEKFVRGRGAAGRRGAGTCHLPHHHQRPRRQDLGGESRGRRCRVSLHPVGGGHTAAAEAGRRTETSIGDRNEGKRYHEGKTMRIDLPSRTFQPATSSVF